MHREVDTRWYAPLGVAQTWEAQLDTAVAGAWQFVTPVPVPEPRAAQTQPLGVQRKRKHSIYDPRTACEPCRLQGRRRQAVARPGLSKCARVTAGCHLALLLPVCRVLPLL